MFEEPTGLQGPLFVSVNFRYVVYATDGENGRKGVLVEQGGKRIADLRCQSDAMSTISAKALDRYGMQADSRPLQLP